MSLSPLSQESRACWPLLPAIFHPSHCCWLWTKVAMMGMEGGCASEPDGTPGLGEPRHTGLRPPSHPTVLGVTGWAGGLGDLALTKGHKDTRAFRSPSPTWCPRAAGWGLSRFPSLLPDQPLMMSPTCSKRA